LTQEKAKILLFDIETTHLKADFGTLLCFGYKWLGASKTEVPSIADYLETCNECGKWDDPANDKPLLKEIYRVLSSADMWVTYYGKGFDVKFINAKLLEHGLPVLPNIPHVDLFFTVRSNLALSRKSLANVSNYIGCTEEKTLVNGKIWKKAMVGHAGSLTYIIKHCRADVLVLEDAYLKLRPLVRTHPRVLGLGACRFCGSGKLQRRGTVINTLKNAKQRIRCTTCGGWDQRDLPKT
jgi:uncharacterized protein YprB with RNaseH-like and TPR domain